MSPVDECHRWTESVDQVFALQKYDKFALQAAGHQRNCRRFQFTVFVFALASADNAKPAIVDVVDELKSINSARRVDRRGG